MAANTNVTLSPESAAALTSEFTIRCQYSRPLTPQLRRQEAADRYAQRLVARITDAVAAEYDHAPRPDAPPPTNPPPPASIDFDQAKDRWLPPGPRTTTTTTPPGPRPRTPPQRPASTTTVKTHAQIRCVIVDDLHERMRVEFDIFLRGCPLAARRDAALNTTPRPIHDVVLRKGTPGAGRDAYHIRKRLPPVPRPLGESGFWGWGAVGGGGLVPALVEAGEGGDGSGDGKGEVKVKGGGEGGVGGGEVKSRMVDAEVQTGDGDGDGDGARVGVDDGAQAEEDWVTSFENLRAWAEGNGDADDIADWEMVEEWPLGPPPVDEFGFELTNVSGGRHWLWDVD